MMPTTSGENGRRPVQATMVRNGGSNCSGAPAWEGLLGRGSPRMDAPNAAAAAAAASSTPIRSTPAAMPQMRSPSVTTHQPYRSVPLSMFDVESELEGYAGINTENLVTVKPSYKTGIQRTSGPNATGVSALLTRRSSQRSPIAALDSGEAHVGHIGGLCSGGVAASAAPTQGAVNSSSMPFAGPPAARIVPGRAGLDSKRMVSIDQAEYYGSDDGHFTCDTYRCPVALRLVETEEKHLYYSGVELPQLELNLGDTQERSRRLHQRRRQVQYGKETVGYTNYLRAVPHRGDREFRNPMHPMTPRPEFNCSKRTFDRFLNLWRRQLHLWDKYNPDDLEPQYTRIGIPTLRRLGLELPSNTPDRHPSGGLSFTPIATQSITSACTPVVPRPARREPSASAAPYQRLLGQQPNGVGGVGTASNAIGVPPFPRPSSGFGGGSWSTTNTPHTPYHGSTHSNGSYQPPLLSVLAQPMIFSPHWAESSRQSSPNPHGGQRGSGYALNSVGGTATAPLPPQQLPGGGVPPGRPASGNAGYMESGGGYYSNYNGFNNNVGYAYHSQTSPYHGPRYTPQTTPNSYYRYHSGGGMGGGAPGGSGGNATASSPLCVGQEAWGNPPRQPYQ